MKNAFRSTKLLEHDFEPSKQFEVANIHNWDITQGVVNRKLSEKL